MIFDLHGRAVDGKRTVLGADLDKVGIDHRGCDIPGHEVIHHCLCNGGILDHDVVTGQVDRLQRTHTGIACEEVFNVAGCRLQVFHISIGGVQVFDSGLLRDEPTDLCIRSLQILNLGVCSIQVCHVRFLGDQAVDLGQLRVQGTDIGISCLQFVRHHVLKGCEVLREGGQHRRCASAHRRCKGYLSRTEGETAVLRLLDVQFNPENHHLFIDPVRLRYHPDMVADLAAFDIHIQKMQVNGCDRDAGDEELLTV